MTPEQKPHAQIAVNLGRYNLASNGKSWCVTLYTSEGNFSETWPEDDKPDIDGLLPSEVMALMIDRLESYWIHTGRVEKLAKMIKWQESSHKFDEAYLVAQIERAEKAVLRLKVRLDQVQEVVEAAQ